MALSTRLMMRQGQALVMTPQLLQAIKLLQFSHLELAAFVQDELDRNPLLERAEDRDPGPEAAPAIDRFAEAEQAQGVEASEAPDWAGSDLAVDSAQLSADLGTDVSNAFDADAPPTDAVHTLELFKPGSPASVSFTMPLFADGFQSHNLTAWSAAVP